RSPRKKIHPLAGGRCRSYPFGTRREARTIVVLRVRRTDLFVLNLRTRVPFRYGPSVLVALPHLFLKLELDVDGRRVTGLAAHNLLPKSFTRHPHNNVADDLA